MSEHRGLDHKGVMRECVQEIHFCAFPFDPESLPDTEPLPLRRMGRPTNEETRPTRAEMLQRLIVLNRTVRILVAERRQLAALLDDAVLP